MRLGLAMSGLTRKPLLAQPRERLLVVAQLEALAVADRVAPDPSGREAATAGSSWRMEPAAALRGLAKVGRPCGRARLVEPREGGQRQIDLAAHLDDGRRSCAAQPQRHRADRAQVGRHVLADRRRCRASRRPLKTPVAVRQRDREAVDLGLDDVAACARRRALGPRSSRRLRASQARSSSSSRALASESIGSRWRTCSNRSSGCPPTRCVGESGVRSSGKLLLERLQLAHTARRTRRRRSRAGRARSTGTRAAR